MTPDKAKRRETRTPETWSIVNGKAGDQFYTEKPDRYLTAISGYHNRKITTERMVVVTIKGNEKPEARNITRVTLH